MNSTISGHLLDRKYQVDTLINKQPNPSLLEFVDAIPDRNQESRLRIQEIVIYLSLPRQLKLHFVTSLNLFNVFHSIDWFLRHFFGFLPV